MRAFPILIEEMDGSKTAEIIHVENVLIVGYGGRNIDKVLEHIRELEEIGVAPPKSIPALYPQKADVLTTEQKIVVDGLNTSGEVEYVLFCNGKDWLVTVGSDHTDRELEKVDIQKSKEACPKPFASTFWRLKDLQTHWDQIILRSFSTVEKGRIPYQQRDITALLPVDNLLSKLVEFRIQPIINTMIFSGTVPTLEGFVYGHNFQYELYDPVLNRLIKNQYSIEVRGCPR